ncbi:hypothetical protein BGZ96_007028 [Linnemannia gamsii]|uniref:Uncharacterized protein n=1 Tax=Linnemannia gamsii TaxID=64522 RepID=A0ABQ7KF55_9FUNG|nr:hypothetical protein BGZ96_007028 [Linnemannia gamsii]
MRFSTVFVAMAALATTSSFTTAAPATTSTCTTTAPAPTSTSGDNSTRPGGNSTRPGGNDTNIVTTALNYALTLENLQAEFYTQGLAKFNESAFTDAGFNASAYGRFVEIGNQENEHVASLVTLIENLKGKPVPLCNYSFPMDNLTEFLTSARALETTSVSAYLGAISDLNGNLSTNAASIAAVEARHAAYLNELWGQSPFPYAFDTPLSQRAVATLASNFITSCPFDIGVKPFAQLNATLPAAGSNSTMVSTSFEGMSSNMTNSTWCQFLYGNKVMVSPRTECALPANLTGYVYVVVTKNKTPVSLMKDTNILAGPALLFNIFNGTSTNGTVTNGTMTNSTSFA